MLKKLVLKAPEGMKAEIHSRDGRYKCVVCQRKFRCLTLDGKRFARGLAVSIRDKDGNFCSSNCAITYAVRYIRGNP